LRTVTSASDAGSNICGSFPFTSADGNHTFDSAAKAAIFDDKMIWFKNQMALKGLDAKPAQIAQALNEALGPGDTKVMQGKHYTLNGAIDTKVCDALEQIVKGKPTIGQMFDSSPWGKYGHLKLKALGTGAYEVSSKNGNWDNNAAATAANVAGWFPGYHAAIGPKGSVMLVPQEETSPATAAAEPATKTAHPNAGALVHFQNSVKKHAGEDGSEAQKLMAAVPGTSKAEAVEALQTAAKQNIELFTHDADGKVVCSDPAKLQAAAKSQLAGENGASIASKPVPDPTDTQKFIASMMHKEKKWGNYSSDDLSKGVAAVQQAHPEFFDKQNGYVTTPYAKKFEAAMQTHFDESQGSGTGAKHVKSTSGHSPKAIVNVCQNVKGDKSFAGIPTEQMEWAVTEALNMHPEAADKDTGALSLIHLNSFMGTLKGLLAAD